MKIKKYSLILLLVMLTAADIQSVKADKSKPSNYIAPAQINFLENAWKAAVKKAKKEGKYIFVDAYASWCGPCRLLKTSTFRDYETAAFFNKNFVNLSVDMEKGEGITLADEWEVQEYPTLMIINPKGKTVLRASGFMNAKELVKFGKQALKIKEKQ